MKLLIDGIEYGAIEFEKQNRATLAGLVEKSTGKSDRIIVFLKTPGGEKYDFYDQDIFGLVSTHAEYVDLVTATKKEIAMVSIYDSVFILERVKETLKKVVELLLTGEFERSMKDFSECTVSIQNIFAMIGNMKSNGLLNFVEGRSYVSEFIGKSPEINSVLTRIVDSISLEDNIMTADIVEYELLPMIDIWENTLPVLYKDVMEGSTLN
jgi:hypothetical protein